MRGRFNREKLPHPAEYYPSRVAKFRMGHHKATGRCPFHEDDHPSFVVNMEKGSYKCYSCPAKGSGIVDFHMQLYGFDFLGAIKDLGAYQ